MVVVTYNFNVDTQGWTGTHNSEAGSAALGSLQVDADGSGTYEVSLSISPAIIDTINFRARVDAGLLNSTNPDSYNLMYNVSLSGTGSEMYSPMGGLASTGDDEFIWKTFTTNTMATMIETDAIKIMVTYDGGSPPILFFLFDDIQITLTDLTTTQPGTTIQSETTQPGTTMQPQPGTTTLPETTTQFNTTVPPTTEVPDNNINKILEYWNVVLDGICPSSNTVTLTICDFCC